MKINKYLGALLIASSALVGCSDDAGVGSDMPGASVGDYITFSGNVGFDNADSNAKTRTIYGDEDTIDGKKGTELRWFKGDKVAIYCAEALEGKLAHYSVVDYTSEYDSTYTYYNGGGDGSLEGRDLTRLEPTGGTPGLKWGSENGLHTFYATYPSPAMFDAQSQVARNFSLNGSTLTGYLPSYQAPSTYDAPIKYEKYGDSALYVIRPAMQYAYMVAKDETTAERPYTDLTFNPIVTAVEFTVTNDCFIETTETVGGTQTSQTPTPIPNIQHITISTTDGTPIAGKFTTTNLGSADMATSISAADAVTSITVPTLGTDQRPITLQPYESIRFTVFMLPNKDGKDIDLTKLNISVFTGIANKTATLSLSNNGVIVQARKKNFLSGIKLKWNVKYTDINWMSQLPGDVHIGDLSIPGAGGAGSDKMSEGRNQQTLSIDSLWNLGVRCFEFFTNRADDNNNTTASLGNTVLVCNGTKSSISLSTAINTIQNKLAANPREMAIVTIGYQPLDNGRQAPPWQTALKNYWETYVNKWSVTTSVKNDAGENIVCKAALYKPDMTLDEARGKLFCFSRPTTIGRDPWWYSLYNVTENVVPILGWGPSPDFWYSRGYTRTDRPYYINETGDFSGIETSTPTIGGSNYMYPSYLGALEAHNDGSLRSLNKASLTSSAYIDHLSWNGWQTAGAGEDDKFMYRICKHELWGGAHTYTKLVDYNTLRAYVQDWRRVSKGFQYPEGTSEAPEKRYKVALNVTKNSNYITSLTVNSVTINGESITTKNTEGYYELDLGTTLPTSSFKIEVGVTGTYSYSNGTKEAEDEHTYEQTVYPSQLIYTNNLYTLRATASRSGYGTNRNPYVITLAGTISSTPTEYGSDDDDSSSSTYCYYWPDSREEKKNDVYQSLIKATTATDYDRTIYINSLCGYFIDSKYPLSYKPDPMRLAFIEQSSGSSGNYPFNDTKYNGTQLNGINYGDYYTDDSNAGAYDTFGGTEGDIASFATWMNEFFYGKLLEIGANNLQGSTGIILCDRISGDPNANPAGYYINQIIIANNFKQHGTNSSAGDKVNTGGGSDDNSDTPEAGVAPRKTFGHNKTADNSNTLVSEWK